MSLDLERPNILWVSFEDTNPFYGCYGDPVARTPIVDQLAAEGTVYPLAFSTVGVCAPARSAVITGMYPISIGTHHMRTTHTNPAVPELPTPYSALLPPHVKCFTEYLRAEGWYCSNNWKTDYQFDEPRSAWDECSEAAHWRNRPDSDQPFFAVFNPHNTHESGMWTGMIDEITFDPAAVIVPPTFPDTPKVREALAQMYTQIEIADTYFGDLLAQLAEDGLADNTIVVHWSDHGPLPRGKRWPYDSGIHIPMIVRWPDRVEAGAVSDQLVSSMDLGPSMLSVCGIQIPAHMHGQAFLGKTPAAPRQYIHASRDRHDSAYDRVRAVRDKRFKYLRNYYPQQPYVSWIPFRNAHPIMGELMRLHVLDELDAVPRQFMANSRPVEELYDCVNDPHETLNLANDPEQRNTLERLRDECDRWLADVGDLGEVAEAEMVAAWYPDGVPQVPAPLLISITPTDPGSTPVHGQKNPLVEAILGLKEDNSNSDSGVVAQLAYSLSEAAEGADTEETSKDPQHLPVEVEAPALIQIHSGVQGASIEYRLNDDPHWKIYAGPIALQAGQSLTIHTRADRIGYEPSPEVSVQFICADQ
ncbi:MAG: sulfatase [Acidimicrobiaceae bacterium]|nr:sulfatase [Acidimicrobiaceae bacterium]MYD07604.1 sulfatase [Acidimicrobiaceae bacterium]MYI59649.1 sulfatase [Acidimicrobiaceae bacterium]